MFLCLDIAAPKWTSGLQGNAFTKKDLQVESTSNESIAMHWCNWRWVAMGGEAGSGECQRPESKERESLLLQNW